MENAVHLTGVRDGQAHGGCQAGCLIYWKEAWLKRVDEDGQEGDRRGGRPAPRRTVERLMEATRKDEERYSCRPRAPPRGPQPAPPWDVRQYVLDVTSGKRRRARHDPRSDRWRVQRIPGVQPQVPAKVASDPRRQAVPVHRRQPAEDAQQTLALQPGDLVRVKSKESDRCHARHPEPQPGHVVRCRDAEVLRPAGQDTASGEQDHPRADRQDDGAEEPLHHPRGHDLHQRLPPALPARHLLLLGGEIWLERVL
jgi:hypothetical protein